MAGVTQNAGRRRRWRPGIFTAGRAGTTRTPGRYRWPVVALLIGLVLVVSLGITQVTVMYLARIQPLRLDPSGLQKLATLRKTMEPRLLSEVSPDDTMIVTVSMPEAGRGARSRVSLKWRS